MIRSARVGVWALGYRVSLFLSMGIFRGALVHRLFLNALIIRKVIWMIVRILGDGQFLVEESCRLDLEKHMIMFFASSVSYNAEDGIW